MEAAIPKEGSTWRKDLRKGTYSLSGTRHDGQELFKWNSQNEPAAFISTEIHTGGTTKEPYAVHKAFYIAQFVPALYLPDNLTPIYGFVRVKSRKPEMAVDAEIRRFIKN